MRPMIFFLLSQSILLPLITGLIRLRRIDKSYRPFFILLVIGILTELISFVIIQKLYKSNIVILNIYTLLEWILIAWQFHAWGFLKQRKKTFYLLLILTTLWWVAENCVLHALTEMTPYFHFLCNFLIVLLSVNEINFMITHQNRNLFRNPKFLICIGFIIYFLYMIVYYWAFEISRFGKPGISLSIMFFVAYVNAIANIIYAIAFLLIPAPQKFTLK